jgi:hypothetical protein
MTKKAMMKKIAQLEKHIKELEAKESPTPIAYVSPPQTINPRWGLGPRPLYYD